MIFRASFSKILLMCGAGLFVQFFASGLDDFKRIEKVLQIDVAQANDRYLGGGGMEQGKQKCEAAKRRALEVAPELLALASWPLDEREPAECLGGQHESVAAFEYALPAAIEIAKILSVVSVMASDYGSVAPTQATSLKDPLAPVGQHPLGQQLAALDNRSLDEVRGGFELDGSGLKFSFGIERAVYINGELIASNVLNLKDLKLATGAGGAPVTLPSGASGALGIIQNGTGNNVSAVITPNLAGTVIQNTMNDQKIQNVTTINASVNSMQAVRSMSVQSAIHSGIVSSLRR